jgi:hypothetical protein
MQILSFLKLLCLLNVWCIIVDNSRVFANEKWNLERLESRNWSQSNQIEQNLLRSAHAWRRQQQAPVPYITFILTFTNSSATSGPVMSNIGLDLLAKAISSAILVQSKCTYLIFCQSLSDSNGSCNYTIMDAHKNILLVCSERHV